jgi:RNA polymerase sigma-70 factor (ECF subfamily)
MIHEAESILHHAHTHRIIGRYQIEAAIQSAHIARRCNGQNNWSAIVELYDALEAISRSPVVAINRALAIAETEGPRAALDAMPRLADDARLNQYQPFWAARAELLSRIGACNKAREAYDIAIGLERDPAVRSFLQQRLAALS